MSATGDVDDVTQALATGEVLGKRKRKDVNYHETSDIEDGLSQADDEDADADDEDEDSDVSDEIDGNDEKPENDEADDTLFVGKGDDEDVNQYEGEDEDQDADPDPNAFYHERKEKFPKFPAYDERLPKVVEGLKSIVSGVLNIAKENDCDSPYVRNFMAKADELLDIPEPSPIRIALIGDAGTGKSSLLNSVIDVPDLARALASGESCTSVAMEYCGPFTAQEKQFAVQITYFDEATIRDLLKEHLKSYSLFLDCDPEWDEDLKQQYKRRADTAVKTFHALFCNIEAFKSVEAVETYLETNKTKTQKLPAEINKYCRELMKQQGFPKGEIPATYHEAEERKAFRKLVDPLLTSTSDPKEPSLWPLVKFVRIGVKGSRVLRNVTIADLPGISDTNLVRVNACNDHLRTCYCLWIIAPIGRAVTSTTVDSLFGRYEERFRGRIAIICTRSDEGVDNQLASALEEQKQPMGKYQTLLTKTRNLQTELSKARRALGSRKQAKDSKARSQKIKDAQKLIKKLEKQKATAEGERLCALVEVRNNSVAKGLERELKGHYKDGKKPLVFCVSNAHYLSYKQWTAATTSFQLKPNQTGIPALRSYVLGLAAPGLLQVLEDYIYHQYVCWFKGVQLWVIRRYVEGASALLSLVKEPQAGVPGRFFKYREDVNDAVDNQFTSTLVKYIPKFGRAAQDNFAAKVDKRHWCSIKSFMNNNGNHSTKMVPKESWNEQWLKPLVDILRKHWGALKRAHSDSFSEQQDAIQDEVSIMFETLKKQPAVTNLEMDGFYEVVNGSIVGIENAFRDQNEKFGMELENIKVDATQDRSTGFFTIAMQPVYDKCKEDTGTGSVKRREETMSTFISSQSEDSPFHTAAISIADTVNGQANFYSRETEAAIEKILKNVFNHFEGMIDTTDEGPKEAPLRQALKPFVDQAQEEFTGLCRELESIKAKYEKKGKNKGDVEEVGSDIEMGEDGEEKKPKGKGKAKVKEE